MKLNEESTRHNLIMQKIASTWPTPNQSTELSFRIERYAADPSVVTIHVSRALSFGYCSGMALLVEDISPANKELFRIASIEGVEVILFRHRELSIKVSSIYTEWHCLAHIVDHIVALLIQHISPGSTIEDAQHLSPRTSPLAPPIFRKPQAPDSDELALDEYEDLDDDPDDWD